MDVDKPLLLKRSDPNFQEECKKLANELNIMALTTLDIVTQLEPYFTSKEIDEREEGLHVLSTILEYAPITKLWQNDVAQLCLFYKGRFTDHYKVIPAILNGVLALSKYDVPLTYNGFSEILTSMFQNVSCQAQPFTERLKIYQILRNMLRNQTEGLLSLGPDFVYGVISAIDGERDPRNLIFLFEWLPEFISTVKLGHLVEEMYEVMSCYFPVDFRVPAQDANGVSRDALAEALKPCLCASNEFAESTIQLALEKLDSDLQIAKCDSLQLLLFGCKKFTTDVYIEYKTGIWSALQKELLKTPTIEVETLILETITEVSRKISSDNANFVDVFHKILETNVGNLNVKQKLFASTCKLFLAMSKSNAICSARVLNEIQPRFINLYNITATKEHKLVLLTVLIEFIKIGDEHNTNTDGIPHFLMSLLVQPDVELRSKALYALCFVNAQFDSIKTALVDQWGRLLVEQMSDSNNDSLRFNFHKNILSYATKCTQELITLINTVDNQHFEVLMDNLSALSTQEPFCDEFLKLQHKYFDKSTKICLKTLNKALNLNLQHETSSKLIQTIEVTLIEDKILSDFCNKTTDKDDLHNVMNILMSIISSYDTNKQSEFLRRHLNIMSLFLQGDDTAIYFFSGLLTNLHLENLKLVDCKVLEKLFVMACQGHDVALFLLANLINKLPEEVISPFLLSFEEDLLKFLVLDNKKTVYDSGTVAVWLTKALYMRGHHDKIKFLNVLIQYLKHNDVVSNGMKVIMSDDNLSFSSKSNCRRRLLYKQQFFIEMCQSLDIVSAVNNNATLAFAALTKEVPMVILKMNLERFMRLIILTLDTSDQPIAALPILTVIQNLIETGDELCEKFLGDFLPRLLVLAERGASMQVRIMACSCIRLYINGVIPTYKLMKFKNNVTDNLGRCLDDKKRLVRQEASAARLKWFLLGAPI